MVGSRVYVGGLPFGVKERDLIKFFRGFGRTRDILIKNGYGFVEFDDYRDADDAVYELNGKELLGERVVVEPARGIERRRDFRDGRDSGGGRGGDDFGRRGPRYGDKYGPPTRTDFRLVVENLSSRISWQDLKDFMRQAGEVTYADAHKQKKNEGVVEFASSSDMRNAIEKLDNTDLNGRRIRLVEDRRRGGGGGGGRGRSHSSSSRSRSRSRRRSRSRSRSRRSSRSRSRSGSKSRPKGSKSPAHKSRSNSKARSASRSHSRSKSPASHHSDRNSRPRSRSGSKDKDKSKSKSKSRSRSRSASPQENKDNGGGTSDHNGGTEY